MSDRQTDRQTVKERCTNLLALQDSESGCWDFGTCSVEVWSGGRGGGGGGGGGEGKEKRRETEWNLLYIVLYKNAYSNTLTWLKVGLLCSREHRSPCRQAPILK